jgi:hypothetical protein
LLFGGPRNSESSKLAGRVGSFHEFGKQPQNRSPSYTKTTWVVTLLLGRPGRFEFRLPPCSASLLSCPGLCSAFANPARNCSCSVASSVPKLHHLVEERNTEQRNRTELRFGATANCRSNPHQAEAGSPHTPRHSPILLEQALKAGNAALWLLPVGRSILPHSSGTLPPPVLAGLGEQPVQEQKMQPQEQGSKRRREH